jgi:hypothetical protein
MQGEARRCKKIFGERAFAAGEEWGNKKFAANCVKDCKTTGYRPCGGGA